MLLEPNPRMMEIAQRNQDPFVRENHARSCYVPAGLLLLIQKQSTKFA